MKKISFILMCSALFFSCSKSKNSNNGGGGTVVGTGNFAIDGIHDVIIDNSVGSNILPLSISRINSSGAQEAITLSASDLPQGLTASFNPASGTPSFSTMLTLNYDYTGNSGTYPVKVIGTGATGIKQYTMNVTLPPLPANGWVLDGTAESGSFSLDSSQISQSQYAYSFYASGTSFTQLRVIFNYSGTARPHDGTYKIVEYPSADNEVYVVVKDENGIYYESTGAGATTLQIKTINGKLNAAAGNAEVKNSFGGPVVTKHLTFNINQF